MSIIGEMYEEQIWESNSDLKKRMQEFLEFLSVYDWAHDCLISEEFKKKFEKELDWNG